MYYSTHYVFHLLCFFSFLEVKTKKKQTSRRNYLEICSFKSLYGDVCVFVMAAGCCCSPLLDILINKLICNNQNPSTYKGVEQPLSFKCCTHTRAHTRTHTHTQDDVPTNSAPSDLHLFNSFLRQNLFKDDRYERI